MAKRLNVLDARLLAQISMIAGNESSMIDWAYWTNPNTITAYSTLLLMIVTGALVAVTWKYVSEVRGQAKDMRDQANAMKRQADAMDTQSNFIKRQSDAMTR